MVKKMQAGMDPKDPKAKEAMEHMQKMKPLYEKHDFWDTQPVPNLSGAFTEGEIEKGVLEEVKQESYSLPPGFEWYDIDLEDEEQLNDVYELLRDHYVEDSDHMFRFDYQKEFLKWALLPPKQNSDWILGVRGGKKNKLFGFITGIPVKLRIKGKMVKMVEINFLCVHAKLRDMRVAPVLIKEITRRTHIKDMWQAIYTAGKVLPKPFTECTYYHRNINTKKLLEVGFAGVPPGRSKSAHIKLLSLPKNDIIENVRQMERRDVKQVQALLDEYLKNFSLSFHFNKEEVLHFMLPRDNVVYSYVVEDPDTKRITDFISYYSLPSTCLKSEKHKAVYAAFSYYMVPKKHTIKELMRQALILAKRDKFDVFNALDIMDNKEVFEDLHFGQGNGNLYYYLYNWYINDVSTDKVGIVLV
ncbi:unnamed protein product [Moneuplotes crassus]|uniref:Glycylpeptide N-tetradecanoyltransferase n=2 Tax=Euplotes crassus TaxID=5936 RepID=A0AAD1UHE1_EUPCR|nr:unnamed protein product [Moneuplotes crassus]